MQRMKVVALALLLVCAGTGAQAQVRGLITGPGQTAFPIAALGPNGCGSDLAATFASTLRKNLELSGLFHIVPEAELPSSYPNLDASATDLGPWAQTPARLIAGGRCSAAGGRLSIEARLLDVAEARVLGGKQYEGTSGDVRRMANRFADEILFWLTGERGPFDSRIAFVSTRGGRSKEIYVMSFDGGDVTQITRNGTINLSPSWSADGRSILFTSFMDRRPKLYEAPASGGPARLIFGGPGQVLGGSASPTGRSIAVAREYPIGNVEIILVSRSGSLLEQLTGADQIDVSPSWSPDGSRLAFCSGRSGGPQIYILNVGSKDVRRLTYRGSYNTSPAWSPQGDRIAYTSRVGGRFQIFVTDAGGGNTTQVTSSSGDNVDPSWSPDGRYLVFSSTRGGVAQLYVADWRGGQQRRLIASQGSDTSPSWSPRLDGAGSSE